jgi:hypothetical protein
MNRPLEKLSKENKNTREHFKNSPTGYYYNLRRFLGGTQDIHVPLDEVMINGEYNLIGFHAKIGAETMTSYPKLTGETYISFFKQACEQGLDRFNLKSVESTDDRFEVSQIELGALSKRLTIEFATIQPETVGSVFSTPIILITKVF